MSTLIWLPRKKSGNHFPYHLNLLHPGCVLIKLMLKWSVTGEGQRLKVIEYLVVLKGFQVTEPMNSMKPSSWEGDSPWVMQEVPSCLLWNWHSHHSVYRTLPPDPILNKVKPLNALRLYCLKIRFNDIPSAL
jgi:hypothetical protein